MTTRTLGTTLLIAMVAGFGAGRWSAPSPPPPSEVAPSSARESETERLLRAGAEGISSASDPAERQRRSEELLEQLVKLFMIDISLRLREPEVNAAASAEPTVAVAPPPPPPAPAAKPAPPRPEPSTASRANEPSAPVSPVQRSLLLYRVVEADGPQQLKKALDLFARLDPMPSYQSARTVTEAELEPLLGRHQGRVDLLDGNASWRLTLEVDRSHKWTPANPIYRLVVRVVKGPNSTSASTGDGPISQFRTNPGDNPAAYYIDFSENALQIYPKKNGDGFVGLYLESKNRSPLKPVGRVDINRR